MISRWAAQRISKAEFGIDEDQYRRAGPNPYSSGLHAVSVGSMLFDSAYFINVASNFHDITFHVIGCGENFKAPNNVILYDEMPFEDTLAYLKHALIGIAAYRTGPEVEYLAESSLKLAQYEYFGLPAVCPQFAAGINPFRCGYESEDPSSMIRATRDALALVGTVQKRDFLSWSQVADRIIYAQKYPESMI